MNAVRVSAASLILLGGCAWEFDRPSDPQFMAYDQALSDVTLAEGANVTVWLDRDVPPSWTVQSSDPSVFQAEWWYGSVGIRAIGSGRATLSLENADGDVVDTETVTVATPDRVETELALPCPPDDPDLIAELVTEIPTVPVGEDVAYYVTAYAGDTPLVIGGEDGWAASKIGIMVRADEPGLQRSRSSTASPSRFLFAA